LAHVGIRKGLIHVGQQKNWKGQTIPLNGEACTIIEDSGTRNDEDDVLTTTHFDGSERDLEWFCWNASKAFRRSRKQAGLRELSFHSLHHGFCTALAGVGKSAVVIVKAAQHSDISTSMRYVHMLNRKLRREVEDAF
jgi:integrase